MVDLTLILHISDKHQGLGSIVWVVPQNSHGPLDRYYLALDRYYQATEKKANLFQIRLATFLP